jgi:hypothetical protein
VIPIESLQLYLALKAHFCSSYDAVKYNFKLKRQPNLNKRSDKHYLIKLARHSDPKGLVISNLIIDPKMWVGHFFETNGQKNYINWRRFQDGRSYWFTEEIQQFQKDSFVIRGNEHPHILRLYLGKKICLDTMIMSENCIHFSDKWNLSSLKDDLVWQQVHFLMTKYSRLISYDREKIFKVLEEKYLDIHGSI